MEEMMVLLSTVALIQWTDRFLYVCCILSSWSLWSSGKPDPPWSWGEKSLEHG